MSVVAHPDNLAAHIVGDNGLWCIAVGEHYQAIVIVLVGIVDGLLERGATAADNSDVTHDLLKRLDYADATVELDYIHLSEAIAKCAIDDTVKVGQVLRGNGSTHVYSDQKLGVEAADGPHILETSKAA